MRGFAIGIALVLLAPAASAQKADAPAVRAGDEWRFVVAPSMTPNRAWVITSVGAAGIEATENGEPLLLSTELNVLESPEVKTSKLRMLSFPLEVGRKWRYETDWMFKPRPSKGTFTSEVSVVAYEKIKVPAGDFDAFKLVEKRAMRGVAANNSFIDAQTSLTYWYAPAANAIVKSVYVNPYLGSTTTTELVEYRPQR